MFLIFLFVNFYIYYEKNFCKCKRTNNYVYFMFINAKHVQKNNLGIKQNSKNSLTKNYWNTVYTNQVYVHNFSAYI